MYAEIASDSLGFHGAQYEWWVFDVEWLRRPGSYRAALLGNRILWREEIEHGCEHNLIVNAGKVNLANFIAGLGTHTAWKTLAIGQSATAPGAGDTALLNQLGGSLAPALASMSVIDAGDGINHKLSADYTWTKTEAGSISVQEGGLFNQTGTPGEMFSRGALGPSTVGQNQQYRLLYTCIFG